jgi:type II secretory pathway component PulF
VTELRALELLRDRYAARKHPLSGLFAAVIHDLNTGRSLDEAFYPWVPHEEIMLIRGGHRGNNLPAAFLDCVSLIEARQKITGNIVSALAYPVMLLAMFIILLLVVAFYVIPELSAITDPSAWTGAAALLYLASQFVASLAGLIILTSVIVMFTASVFSLPYWTGALRVRFDSIPPWSIYRLVVGSVWMLTMATLLRSRIQLDYILEDMLQSDVLRPWLRERVQLIYDRLQITGNFGTLFAELDLNFPDTELAEDLAIYAGYPDFYKNLYDIARDWLDEGTERVTNQCKQLNIFLIFCILIVLCGLGLAIGSMQQQLMGGL